MPSLKEELTQRAHQLGFDAIGISTIQANLRKSYYKEWIASGKHGTMSWMEQNLEKRLDPSKIVKEAKSIISLGVNYYSPETPRRGRIAKYAQGKDYHRLLYKKLKKLCSWLREQGGENKPYVDTGPLLEKPIAEHAGLGWQGKSTILIHKKMGTWLTLGEIITTLEIPNDAPPKNYCGKCTACIDACPTRAITAPYQLDSNRCIAYLTIEHKGPIPLEYRKAIGDHLFGCDDCLDVCPWNRWAAQTREEKFLSRDYPDLCEMLNWSDADFDQHFCGTPIKRLNRERLFRNICVVLGNIGNQRDLPYLTNTLGSESAMVAEHAQWAIDQINARLQEN